MKVYCRAAIAMTPSANGQKHDDRPRVYVVERRAEFRRLNAQVDPNVEGHFYEPEISYLEDAYVDEKQAYGVAIQQQIAELDEQVPENATHNGRKVAAQSFLSLKERLKKIHKEVDTTWEAHEDANAPDNTPVVKYAVLEFPMAERVPFQETEFLKDLDNPSGSEEEEEEEGDEDDGEEDEVEGEEGVEEGEEEEEDDDDEPVSGGPDHVIELDDDDDDEGEEVDDDDDDDEDEDGVPSKKQRT